MVNFLDVTLNLNSGHYAPYNKPGNTPLYVHASSNHPPNIINNIPKMINTRLSHISSNEEVFQQAAPTYQDALHRSGYTHKLTYAPAPKTAPTGSKRQRRVIWFNPPYSKTVETNVGRLFLKLIDREFHAQHPLHSIFNRNYIKVSYCCMPNIKNLISKHNKKLSTPHTDNSNSSECNCRVRNDCPLNGKCLSKSIVYQATVSATNTADQTYIGLCDTTFKVRYGNHKASFNHASKRTSTELSKYVWSLKDSGKEYKIKWKIVKHAKSYSNTTKKCNLCIWEKFFITTEPAMSTLNKRNELLSSCRHSKKYALKNFVT